jgi:hypothetical protein
VTKRATAAKDGANDPTFIAQCPECDCLIACVVVTWDDDSEIEEDELLADALKHRAEWKRGGLKVSTVRVQDVREWSPGKAFKHADGCSRDRRRKVKPPVGQVQGALL